MKETKIEYTEKERARNREEPKVQISFVIPITLWNKVNEFSRAEQLTLSAAARTCIKRYFDGN